MMDKVYIQIEVNKGECYTNVECFLALYVYKYLQSPKNVDICYVKMDLIEGTGRLLLNNVLFFDEQTKSPLITIESSENPVIGDLRMPIYQKDRNTFIAGVCAVCRELVGCDAVSRQLLGFKESCLLAPAECSVWTRFCEVDIVMALNNILLMWKNGEIIKELPQEISRFEKHMSQPVRMHNIYKLARERCLKEQACSNNSQKIVLDNKILKDKLQIEHRFAEGVAFTIADLLLYPCMRLLFEHCQNIEQHVPLTAAWIQEIDTSHAICSDIFEKLLTARTIQKSASPLRIAHCESSSLYKSDPKRYKPKNRIFTEQSKVDAALDILNKQFGTNEFSSNRPNDFEKIKINWDTIEPAHERDSALPAERLARKREQLESMVNAIIAIARPGDKIVDFCSGTGHLGILLGIMLPKCTVILIENKAKSLERAKRRANDLNLKNVHFFQCNIDYFIGNFDLGTSLHACGTATDVVIQQCLRSRAKFVCCPCCYGSVCSMKHVTYPLSKRFRDVLTQKDFMYIAHAADQAHDLGITNCRPETSQQGQYCMDIVDTDRMYCCEEVGYEVILTRLKPEQCTPKNRLLVGWCKKQRS